MKINRSRNAKRNIVYGVIYRFFNMLFPFVIRTILLYILGSEYLGLNSLFTSILSFLSLAELGVGSALVYSMYKPIAEDDSDTICALLNLYRRLYRYIGTIVLVIGLCLIPLLPRLVNNDCPPDVNLYTLYLVFLLNSVISYWMFGYKQSLLTSHQRTDIISKNSMIVQLLMYLIQILCLFLFRNYYLYILWLPVFTVVTNLVNAYITDKMYPHYKCRGEISRELQQDIKKKVIALFGTKANSIVMHAMDNIVISAFLGLSMVGLYGNYYYIMNAVAGLMTIVYQSMTAGIGNSLETETGEKNYRDFEMIAFANFWLVSFCTISLLCLYQPFMRIWVHDENMLDMIVVVLLAVYFYVYQIRRIVLMYKDAAGIWWEDRFRPYVMMFTNLIGNFLLVQIIGIYGVILSTIISMLISVPWENYTVFKYIFNLTSVPFYRVNILYLALTTGMAFLTYWLCSFLPEGIWGLIAKASLCLFVPNVLIVLLFRKTKKFQYAVKLILRR